MSIEFFKFVGAGKLRAVAEKLTLISVQQPGLRSAVVNNGPIMHN